MHPIQRSLENSPASAIYQPVIQSNSVETKSAFLRFPYFPVPKGTPYVPYSLATFYKITQLHSSLRSRVEFQNFPTIVFENILSFLNKSSVLSISRTSKFFSKATNIYLIMKKILSFPKLIEYVGEKYPEFDLIDCNSFEDFQKLGSPFHYAIRNYDLRLLRLLIDCGVDINQLDKNGNTALDNLLMKYTNPIYNDYALADSFKTCDKKMIIILIQERAFLVRKTHYFLNPTELFAKSCGPEYLSTLIYIFGYVLTERNIDRFSGCLFALLENKNSLNQKIDIITAILLFLQKGFQIDYRDRNGKTLLYHAVNNQNLDLVEFLRSHGANPKRYSKKHDIESPLNYAITKKREFRKKSTFLKNEIHKYKQFSKDVIDLEFKLKNTIDKIIEAETIIDALKKLYPQVFIQTSAYLKCFPPSSHNNSPNLYPKSQRKVLTSSA